MNWYVLASAKDSYQDVAALLMPCHVDVYVKTNKCPTYTTYTEKGNFADIELTTFSADEAKILTKNLIISASTLVLMLGVGVVIVIIMDTSCY